ncbi:MAG: FkbM family methyltransferase [Thermomicrobiales bacterium]
MLRRTPAALRDYGESALDLLQDVEPRTTVVRLFAPGHLAGDGPHRIHLRRTGETFLVRSPMDVWSVKETFIDRLYERYGFTIEPGWTVVDIGAAIGEFTVFAARIPGTTVIACEPFPGSVDLLRENIALNLLENVTVIPKAVAAETGTMLLDLRGEEPLEFVSAMQRAGAEALRVPEGHIAIPAIPLSEVLADTPRAHIDLLKLDCEGAEYEILMQAPAEALAAVDRIVMEYHDRTTAHTHPELERFLTDAGFAVRSVPNVVHPDEIGYLWAARRDLPSAPA